MSYLNCSYWIDIGSRLIFQNLSASWAVPNVDIGVAVPRLSVDYIIVWPAVLGVAAAVEAMQQSQEALTQISVPWQGLRWSKAL